jgi:hypothetical protein
VAISVNAGAAIGFSDRVMDAVAAQPGETQQKSAWGAVALSDEAQWSRTI